jgi:hypothetical protein
MRLQAVPGAPDISPALVMIVAGVIGIPLFNQMVQGRSSLYTSCGDNSLPACRICGRRRPQK